MSNLLKRAARRNTGWNASGDTQLYGARRLNAELNAAFKGLRQRISLIFGRGQGGLSGRLLTLGDMVLEASVTRVGRITTAGIALFFAWLLLGL